MSLQIVEGIHQLVDGYNLSQEKVEKIMQEIMSGKAEEAQIASFLTALRIKGENIETITGAAKIMRKFANRITPKIEKKEKLFLVDTCGTGGDKAKTFNISTLSAIITAAAGIPVAKHGNRSVSSGCGSADILESMGININLEPIQVQKMIENNDFGFMFAPKFHPAMKYAMPTRKKLGMRTIFNILGPLTNPANAPAHILGVFDRELVKPIAKVMLNLGAKKVFVVHTVDNENKLNIDEIIPRGKIVIAKGENIDTQKLTIKEYSPEDLNLSEINLKDILGGTIEKNLKIARDLFIGNANKSIVNTTLINSAFAIVASGKTDDLKEAFEISKYTLESGKALTKLKELVIASKGNIDKFNELFNQD